MKYRNSRKLKNAVFYNIEIDQLEWCLVDGFTDEEMISLYGREVFMNRKKYIFLGEL